MISKSARNWLRASLLLFLGAMAAVPALAQTVASGTGHGGVDVGAATPAYFEGGYWILLWGALIGIAVDMVFLITGFSARLRDWALRVTKRRWIIPGLYGLFYVVISSVILLPWTVYTDYYREHQYGLSNQSFGAWFGEFGMSFAINIVVFALLLMVIFAVIRWLPRTWWLAGAAVMTGFVAIGALLAPVYLAPLFNTYTEMPQGPLRDRIVAMAEAHNVPAEHIYVFDASKQTDRISANVSGLGPTIRISLNDNLLNRTSPDEVAAVMGHELGHYVLGHVQRLILSFGLVFLFAFGVIAFTAPRLLARYGDRWGVHNVSDPAVLPLFSAIASALFLVLTPVTNTIIRTNEAEADAFGLDAAKAPDGFAMAAMRLSEYRKIEPGPIEEFLFYDHPSGKNRVERSMQWKADHVPNATIVYPKPLDAPVNQPAQTPAKAATDDAKE